MLIIKIGGGENINVQGILEDVAELVQEGKQIVLVHGANAIRDDLAQRLGTPTKTVTSIKGFESVLTDEAAMDVMLMAYSGLRNKRIVELGQRVGLNAIGLTGLDGGLIRGEQNRGIRVEENGKKKILRDFSGKPVEVNAQLLTMLLDAGYTPVVTVPVLDPEKGIALNTQNDSIIATMAAQMKAEAIVDVFAERGLLEDRHDPSTLISRLTKEEFAQYVQKTEGRMRRKVYGMHQALEAGVQKVVFGDGRSHLNPLKQALEGAGTIIE